MKKYIILSLMLALTLSISAQNTNQGRATRTSSDVKEKKNSEAVKKAEKPGKSSTQYKDNSSTRSKGTNSNTGSQSRTRTTTSSSKRDSNYGMQERTGKSTTTREKEVRTTTTERSSSQDTYRNKYGNQGSSKVVHDNNGVRERETGSGRDNNYTRTRTRAGNSVTRREYTPVNEQESVTVRKTYTAPERKVVVRTVSRPDYVPRSVEYRRTYYPYHVPPRVDIIWSVRLYNEYRYIYPHYNYWYYPTGYRIHTVSAYDAFMYIGEFARIYGKVYDTWYSYDTDEYYLYFGEPYPYQDFTVIIEGRIARRISRRPERYFTGRHIAVTGIVSAYESKPEMIIKKRSQIDPYF